jgi:hypothetical protein
MEERMKQSADDTTASKTALHSLQHPAAFIEKSASYREADVVNVI